jgi:hypothetical protein
MIPSIHERKIDGFCWSIIHLIHAITLYFNTPRRKGLEALLRRIALLVTSAVLPHGLFGSALVLLEVLDLLGIHMLHHGICLPLLEAESQSLMAVVLVVCLIFVIFHLDEVRVHSVGVEAEGDQRVNRGRLGDDLESPRLLVLELDHFVVAPDDFVALVLGFLEELGKCEPLAGYEWC